MASFGIRKCTVARCRKNPPGVSYHLERIPMAVDRHFPFFFVWPRALEKPPNLGVAVAIDPFTRFVVDVTSESSSHFEFGRSYTPVN